MHSLSLMLAAAPLQATRLMLAQEFCFWRHKYQPSSTKKRRKALRHKEVEQLSSVTTWSAYSAQVVIHMARTPQNGSMHIFRSGILPEYDDPLNRSGGLFRLALQGTNCAADAFRVLCGSLVLGQLPHHMSINGVTFVKKGTNCGLNVWVGSSAKQMRAHVLEWFTKELDGFIASSVFCPIKCLLPSIQKQQAPEYLPQPPLQQGPQGPTRTKADGTCKTPPPLIPPPTQTTRTNRLPRPVERIPLAASTLGHPGILPLDSAEEVPVHCGTAILDLVDEMPAHCRQAVLDLVKELPAHCSMGVVDLEEEPPAHCSTGTLPPQLPPSSDDSAYDTSSSWGPTGGKSNNRYSHALVFDVKDPARNQWLPSSWSEERLLKPAFEHFVLPPLVDVQHLAADSFAACALRSAVLSEDSQGHWGLGDWELH